MKAQHWVRCLTAILAVGGMLALASPTQAQLVSGPYGPGGTWNVYELVTTGRTFKDARNDAASRFDPIGMGVPGHLVTLSNVAENNFVHSFAGGGDVWIGLTDRFGAAPGAFESDDTANKFTTGWAWVTGEPFTFQNWGGGEPNNWPGGSFGAEDAAHLRSDALWNDNASGYGDNDPAVDPAGKSQAEGSFATKYVIEYNTALPSAAVFPRGPATLPAGVLPGPAPRPMEWGIREVRDITGGWPTTAGAAAAIASGGGTIYDGYSQVINHVDPTTNGSAGRFGGDRPFLSNDAHFGGEDDQEIAMVGHAKVLVTPAQAGMWSFGSHSDDGFAMRIRDAGGNLMKWSSASGAGGLYGPGINNATELAFPDPTGDSNTRGSLNLPAGTYDIEYVSYENYGGAHWELYAAKGVVTDDASPTWALVGAKPNEVRHYYKPTMVDLGDGNHFDVQVVDGTPADNIGAHTVANARQLLDNPGTNPVFFGLSPVLNMKDPQDGVCCGGIDSGMVSFPGLDDGVDNEDFATRSLGALVMPADGWVTIHIQSDDGFGLTIDGGQFEIVSTGGGTTYVTNGGETVNADYGTGNTNTVLNVQLSQGTHDFEFIHWDGCCGAYAQMFVGGRGDAGGMILGSFNEPIDQGGPEVLALIPEPSSYVLACLGLAGLAVIRRRRNK